MGRLTKAIALCNNEVALIAWDVDGMIPGCLGFDVTRLYPQTGERKRLASWVPFEGQSNPDWQPQDTGVWPVQKTFWRDLTLRRRRDKTERRPDNVRVKYEIRPVGRLAPGLEAVTGIPEKTYQGAAIPLGYLGPAVTSNEICISSDCGDVKAAFTNGILAAQWLTHIYKGGWTKKNQKKLTDDINTEGNPVRTYLAGDVLAFLKALVERAASQGGKVHLALYELGDGELKDTLVTHKDAVALILANSAKPQAKKHPDPDDEPPVWDAGNKPARDALHAAQVDIQDRMFNNNHIGHNKFAVYVDAKGVPQAVLTGSTNWTATGLCGQTNNASIIENRDIAKAYFAYWQRLHDDALPEPSEPGANTSNKQGPKLRRQNQTPAKTAMNGGGATAWFLPDTTNSTKPPTEKALADLASPAPKLLPPDLAELFAAIKAAKQAVFFLAFLPSQGGVLSIIETARQAGEDNPELLVVGAVSDPTAMPGYTPKAKGATETPEEAMARSPSVYEARHTHIVRAAAIGAKDIVGNFETELLKLGHAVVHDKIVVVDPLGDDPVVAFGSHNLGYKASYENDENLVIIRGNKALAEAYAVHCYDIYDHFRYRAWTAALRTGTGKGSDGHIDVGDRWLQAYVARQKGDIAAYLLGEPLPAPAKTKPAKTPVKPAKQAVKKTAKNKAKKTKRTSQQAIKKTVKKTKKKAVKKTAKKAARKKVKTVKRRKA